MSDRLIDVRTPLSVSENVRVELGADGTLYLVAPHVTLHLERDLGEELATTLARAVVRLRKLDSARARPGLQLVRRAAPAAATDPDAARDS